MREIILEQGSAEWHKFRENKVGASLAPIVMGVGFQTPYNKWQQMMGLIPEQKKTSAMQRGLDLEPIVRLMASAYAGVQFKPKVILHDTLDWHYSSFDGLTDDYKHAVEIKCPGWADHQLARQGLIPDKYYPQLQHMMFDCELDNMIYSSYFDHENEENEVVYVVVNRDDDYIKKLYAKEQEFYKCIIEFTEPERMDKDFNQNNSKEWADIMAKVLEEQKLENYHKENKENYKSQAIAMAGNRSTIGSGYKLSKSIRQGNVDYKAVPELKGINLDQYRKGPVESWRISHKEES